MRIFRLQIKPGSDAEDKFKILLKSVGVKPDLVMCRVASVFNTRYDEYILSEGLYKQIQNSLDGIKMV